MINEYTGWKINMNYDELLNTNPNPILADLITFFSGSGSREKNSAGNLYKAVNELKEIISLSPVPKGMLNLLDKLNLKIKEKDFYAAKSTVENSLKKAKPLMGYDDIQKKIDRIYNLISEAEDANEEDPHEKALFLLSELAYINKSAYTPLSEIKNELSTEVFNLYVTFRTTGCVKGDGWAFGIFGNMPQLVPFIPESMNILGYKKTAKAVSDVINVFPEETCFLFDDNDYTDVLNFIENPKRKVSNPKLEKYTKEERETFCSNYHDSLCKLEDAGSEILSDEPNKLYTYFDNNSDVKVWKKIRSGAIK